ncbi:hypothetical protein AMATHDRAFT_146061 [Amanita thiersii Skay4041]|uniref:N-acetyltransferase ECO1 n=1 Tax=Amanita thiersii Skay4041 TaxID=703135 RepID=A0A2A9NHK6_9AGAR|nr:hypothetical protein AMATHDRAFT_146061 [Amanita thiersii Skay4041]
MTTTTTAKKLKLDGGKHKKTLVQLHFCIDKPVLRTCPSCALSYTKGAADDEALHRVHCARVQKGMEWGREEERENVKAGVVEVAGGVKLSNGVRGRIICFRADIGGKIGSKVTTLLETVNLTLSAPPMAREALAKSKLYLFLVPPSQTKTSGTREKIVGWVVAQRIETAMAIASPDQQGSQGEECSNHAEDTTGTGATDAPPLVVVDTGMGIFCHPEHLPTPMGIPRLFVASTHRRQGIATKLLTAAARTFIHGCVLDPRKGQVAFTQPTGDGNAVMLKWGGGGVRIYEG